jgi:hypothetical protein
VPENEIQEAIRKANEIESLALFESGFFDDQYTKINEAIEVLKRLTDFSSETAFKNFDTLIETKSSFDRLSTFKEGGDNHGRYPEYNAAIEKVKTAAKIYDPKAKQAELLERYKIQNWELQTERDKFEAEVKFLKEDMGQRIEDVQRQGVTFVHQNTLVALPQRPAEIKLDMAPKAVRVAKSMITNRDYISASAAMSGNNDPARIAQGLDQPAFVSWRDAALYCNWLSRFFALDECYIITDDNVTYEKNNGYRLPEEAEIRTALNRSVIRQSDITRRGIWSSEANSGKPYFRKYQWDAQRNRLVSENRNANEEYRDVMLWVVRNDQ